MPPRNKKSKKASQQKRDASGAFLTTQAQPLKSQCDEDASVPDKSDEIPQQHPQNSDTESESDDTEYDVHSDGSGDDALSDDQIDEIGQAAICDAIASLKWKPFAKPRNRAAVYTGDSIRTQERRRHMERQKQACMPRGALYSCLQN